MDESFTLRQAAAFANVSVDTVRRWTRVGALPHHRVLRRIHVRRSDLETLIFRGLAPSRTAVEAGSR